MAEQFTKLDYEQALAFLGQVNAEEMNWRKARLVLGDLIQRGLKAQKALNELDGSKAGLEEAILRLTSQRDELQRTIQNLKGDVTGFQTTLQAQENERSDRLSKIDKVIVEKEGRAADLDRELDNFRERLNFPKSVRNLVKET